jgi:hypothetical protein
MLLFSAVCDLWPLACCLVPCRCRSLHYICYRAVVTLQHLPMCVPSADTALVMKGLLLVLVRETSATDAMVRAWSAG